MTSDKCLTCKRPIRYNSHAVTCDGCDRWNHRLCGTNITSYMYYQARQGKTSLSWMCVACSLPELSSGSFIDPDIILPPPSPFKDVLSPRDSEQDPSPNISPLSSPISSLSQESLQLPPSPPTSPLSLLERLPLARRLPTSPQALRLIGLSPASSPASSPPTSQLRFFGLFGLSLESSPSLPSHPTTPLGLSLQSSLSPSPFAQGLGFSELPTTAPQTANKVTSPYASLPESPEQPASPLSPPPPPAPLSLSTPEVPSPPRKLELSSFLSTASDDMANVAFILDPLFQEHPIKTEPGIDKRDMQEYHIVEGATSRGRDLLVDRYGYTYTLADKTNRRGTIRWRCAVRNRKVRCAAAVSVKDGVFTRGPQQHRCQPKTYALTKAKVKAHINNNTRPLHVSASTIVNEAIVAHRLENPASQDCFLNPDTLARVVNRKRQSKR